MSYLYVRSTDGDNADNGSSWALAKASATGAANIDAAGDTIALSQSHDESTASATTIALAGTIANPSKMLCVNDGAEPPTALADTAVISTTGASNLTVTGSGYVYGITFNAGTGTSTVMLNLHPGTGGRQVYQSSKFKILGTSVNNRLAVCAATSTSQDPATVEWKNCDVHFANASQHIQVNVGRFVWKGGSILAGSAAVNGLITGSSNPGRPGEFLVDGVDLSNGATGLTLTNLTQDNGYTGVFRNCKLPAGWTGDLGTVGNPNTRIEMYNADAGDTNYKLWIETYAGSVKTETTIKRTGGSSDGVTGYSWKFTMSANASLPVVPLVSPEIFIRVNSVGNPVTITLHLVHDSVGSGTGNRLTNKEFGADVQYLGTSGVPLASFVDTEPSILASATDLADSTETWTTTGLTTPVKQKLTLTFTPQEQGYAIIRLKGYKASSIVYVDVEPILS